MAQQSAGLLMCRKKEGVLDFFLVHPGGPFWAKKQEGTWGIPKGLAEGDEELLATARREFEEETGITPTPPFHSLGSAKMKSGKIVHTWCFEGKWEPSDGIKSNYINIDWPPRSGKSISIPEVDQAAWMKYDKALTMINSGQIPFLERAEQHYREAENNVPG